MARGGLASRIVSAHPVHAHAHSHTFAILRAIVMQRDRAEMLTKCKKFFIEAHESLKHSLASHNSLMAFSLSIRMYARPSIVLLYDSSYTLHGLLRVRVAVECGMGPKRRREAMSICINLSKSVCSDTRRAKRKRARNGCGCGMAAWVDVCSKWDNARSFINSPADPTGAAACSHRFQMCV